MARYIVAVGDCNESNYTSGAWYEVLEYKVFELADGELVGGAFVKNDHGEYAWAVLAPNLFAVPLTGDFSQLENH